MFDHRKYPAFAPIGLTDRTWPNQSIAHAPSWCSVDLRDGNQALIEPMNVAEKTKMFELLVEVGFKEIEVGFPSAAQPEFDFVRGLIECNKIPDDVTIQVLTQAREELIDRTFEALKGAPQAILHLYNSTSIVQREKVFKTDSAGILKIAEDGARHVLARAQAAPETNWTLQYSPESFTGTEIDFAVEVCDAVNEIWQPHVDRPVIINLPATVEMAAPNVYADQVESFCRSIKYRDKVIVSVHTHNDRGCAVAAAELAVMAGAQRVEGTLLGNGERTGNMDIVVMAMNLYSQGIDPELDLSDMDKIIKVVETCTKIDVHPRQPYAGDLVFTAFSGSHQDAIKKCLDLYEPDTLWEIAYLPIDPRDLGRAYQDVIRVNSQSGKGGVAYIMANNYGFQLPRWLQIDFSRVVQNHTEFNGGEVKPEKIWELFQTTYLKPKVDLLLKKIRYEKDEKHLVQAELYVFGELHHVNGSGEGTLDAFVTALESEFGIQIQVIEYEEHSLGQTVESEAVTYVEVRCQGERLAGVATNNDIVESSLVAVLNAVGPVIAREQALRAQISSAA